MSFTDEMRNLRSAIEDTKEKTKRAVKKVKSDTNEIIREAQALVQGYAQTQRANAKQLREDLRHSAQNLVGDVKEMRGTNIRKQKERRREFAQGQAAFWGKQKPEGKKKEKPA